MHIFGGNYSLNKRFSNKKFILILIALIGLGTSSNAQFGNQDIGAAGRVIKT